MPFFQGKLFFYQPFGATACISLFWICSVVCLPVQDSLGANEKPISGIGPVGRITKVQGDLLFTEGPVSDGKGNLYFTDIPANRIYKIDKTGDLDVFREPSGHANGLMFLASGELAACEMDGQVVALSPLGKSRRVLAAGYMGKRFNAPNDLVVDHHGGVYFTDPHFRAPTPLPQGKRAVYYVSSDGNVSRLIDDLPAPNGVILSIKEDLLYVVPSQQAEMMAYQVTGPGKLGPGHVFCRLKQSPGRSGSGGDGLTIDVRGNLYIASGLGIQVFNPAGELLGVIKLPEVPANVTFGGPGNKTLFATARTSLYSMKMEIPGYRFPGK